MTAPGAVPENGLASTATGARQPLPALPPFVGTGAALKDAVRAALIEAGFSDAGFARAQRLDEDANRMNAWLADGRHGEMEWLADRPERRATLSRWVRTVIVAAWPYPLLRWEPGEPRYASYAEGEDYHKSLRRALGPAAAILRSAGGRAHRIIDTSACFERAWAREAGVGFIGRNRMLIARRGGPAVLLAAILTDRELAPDAPGTGTCGECVRCLEACPTQALDDRGLDARRCISYMTIELRRPMTDEERNLCGPWTFGCDDCVTSCPYTVRGLPPVRPVLRGTTRFGK